MRQHPYLLLSGAALLWAGNFVLGRAMRGHVPPVGLAFWRWGLALAILLVLQGRHLVASREAILRRWGVVAALGILGVGNFNLFLYLGLQRTTATNALLLNAAAPAFILAISFAAGQGRPTGRMLLGVLLSLAGVATILAQGRLASLSALRLNAGDLWVLAAVLSWSVYTVLLARRPRDVEPMVLLTALVLVGTAWIAPFYAWEVAQGARMTLDLPTVATILYVGIFASLVAYAFWNAGVARAGASRAGVSLNLMPAFGTALAVLLLGEPFQAFQAAGIALIVGGVTLVQLGR
ncbi:MAG: DMT family transporter [Anaeromyxobacteraceae bacterium]